MRLSIRCKYFNGTQNAACEAGVKYESVELGKGTRQYSLPCIKSSGISRLLRNELGATCEKCEMPTEADLLAEEEADRLRMERVKLIRETIVKHLGGPWKKGEVGASGRIPCPACTTGTVAFSRAGYNGHIHAQCSTADCATWME